MGNSLHTNASSGGLQEQMINRFVLPIPTLHSFSPSGAVQFLATS
jgi:hypothetical protein